jgi:hypothetical protein
MILEWHCGHSTNALGFTALCELWRPALERLRLRFGKGTILNSVQYYAGVFTTQAGGPSTSHIITGLLQIRQL